MFEAFTNFMLIEHLAGLTFDPPNASVGYFRQIDPDRQPFPTSDGHISIVAYSDEAWPRVFDVLAAPEVLEDGRFATRGLRAKNLALLYRAMAQLTPSFTTAELLARCHAAQIPAQPVRDLADIMDDPHLVAIGFFAKADHPVEGPWHAMRQPVRFGCPIDEAVRMAPLLGEHDAHVRNRSS